MGSGMGLPETEQYEGILDHVVDELGEHLRAVDWYSRDGVENLYIRSDVAALYSWRDFERLRTERILTGFSCRYSERLYRAGEFEYAVRVFHDAVIMYFPTSREAGFVVSMDADANVSVPSFGRTCLARITS